MSSSKTKPFQCIISLHQWNLWSYSPETGNTECLEIRTCQHCGASEFRKEKKHDWSEWIKVTNKCQETRKCNNCGVMEERNRPHTLSEWVTTATNCQKIRKCKSCDTEVESLVKHICDGKVERTSPTNMEVVFTLKCKHCSYEFVWKEKLERFWWKDIAFHTALPGDISIEKRIEQIMQPGFDLPSFIEVIRPMTSSPQGTEQPKLEISSFENCVEFTNDDSYRPDNWMDYTY